MPIRKRNTGVFEPEVPAPVAEEFIDGFQPDNVIPISRADDLRGVFDRKQDAFPGSHAFKLSGGNKAMAGSMVRRESYVMPENIPYPDKMRVQDLLANVRIPYEPRDTVEVSTRNRVRSPMTAIRAWCINSQGGSPKAVKECDVMECPFWPFRMGKNTMRGRG